MDGLAAGVRALVPGDRDPLSEVLHAAAQQTLGEIAEPPRRAIDDFEPIDPVRRALDTGNLRVRVELAELVVDRGLDAGDERQGRVRADQESG